MTMELVIIRGAGNHRFIAANGDGYSVQHQAPSITANNTTGEGVDYWVEKYFGQVSIDGFGEFDSIKFYSDPDEYRSLGWNKAQFWSYSELIKELWWTQQDEGDIYIFMSLDAKDKWLKEKR